MSIPAQDGKLFDCPALVAIRVISGKWKTRILWLLRARPAHFGAILKTLPGVSAKVLDEQLGQLEADGLISRHVEMRGGVKFVRYDYTDYGRSLIPALNELGDWGIEHGRKHAGIALKSPRTRRINDGAS